MDNYTNRIKEELSLYPANHRRYHELREEILYGSNRPDADSRNASYVSDTTGSKGRKLAELEKAGWVRWLVLIESTLTGMRNYDRELVRLRYFEGYSPDKVAIEMFCSREKFFKDIDRIIYGIRTVAIREGLLKGERIV